MRVHMQMSGTIVISAENHLEAYALRKWCEDNPLPEKLIVNCSLPVDTSPLAKNRLNVIRERAEGTASE